MSGFDSTKVVTNEVIFSSCKSKKGVGMIMTPKINMLAPLLA